MHALLVCFCKTSCTAPKLTELWEKPLERSCQDQTSSDLYQPALLWIQREPSAALENRTRPVLEPKLFSLGKDPELY